MQIGELSKRTAVSVRMLRYYEDEGLLHPRRTSSGYREYGDAEEQTVRRIRLLGAAGLTLETIRQILPCVRNDRPEFEPCDEMRRNSAARGKGDECKNRGTRRKPPSAVCFFAGSRLIERHS
jgi:DNA-binding transcriptional MerR regulator